MNQLPVSYDESLQQGEHNAATAHINSNTQADINEANISDCKPDCGVQGFETKPSNCIIFSSFQRLWKPSNCIIFSSF